MRTNVKVDGKPTFQILFMNENEVKICGNIHKVESSNMSKAIDEIKEIINANY